MAKLDAKIEADYTFIDPELTDKERRFIDEYFVDMNRVKAFFRAGYTAKDEKVAAVRVSKMMQRPQIVAAIKKRQDELRVQTAQRSPLQVMQNNLNFWMDLAEQDIPIDEEGNPDGEKFAESRKARLIAQEVAKDMAPYLHPKLATVVHRGENADGSEGSKDGSQAIEIKHTVVHIDQKKWDEEQLPKPPGA